MSVMRCDMFLIEDRWGERMVLTMDQARAAVRIYDAGKGQATVDDVVCEWTRAGRFLINALEPSEDDIHKMR